MAVRTSFPESPWVSRLPKNSISSMSAVSGLSAAAVARGSTSATPTINGLNGILAAFEPFVEFQLGKEVRMFVSGEQLDVTQAGPHGIAIRGREPQQTGHGEYDAGGGEAAHRQQPAWARAGRLGQALLDRLAARGAQARDSAGVEMLLGCIERALRVLQKFFFGFHGYKWSTNCSRSACTARE